MDFAEGFEYVSINLDVFLCKYSIELTSLGEIFEY